MSLVHDGGSAFPVPELCDTSDGLTVRLGMEGMSLRDWFAGQALAGITTDTVVSIPIAAELAYQFADAMLEERGKRDG